MSQKSDGDKEWWDLYSTDVLIRAQHFHRGILRGVEGEEEGSHLSHDQLKSECTSLLSIGEILQERQAQSGK